MASIPETLDTLCQRLTAADVPATWEVEKFHAPGVYVKLLRAEQPFMAGDYQITVQLVAAVPDRHARTVVTDLETLTSKLTQLHWLPIDRWTFEDTALELNNSTVLPAAATTITL